MERDQQRRIVEAILLATKSDIREELDVRVDGRVESLTCGGHPYSRKTVALYESFAIIQSLSGDQVTLIQ